MPLVSLTRGLAYIGHYCFGIPYRSGVDPCLYAAEIQRSAQVWARHDALPRIALSRSHTSQARSRNRSRPPRLASERSRPSQDCFSRQRYESHPGLLNIPRPSGTKPRSKTLSAIFDSYENSWWWQTKRQIVVRLWPMAVIVTAAGSGPGRTFEAR